MSNRTPYATKPIVPRISGTLSPDEVTSIISEKCLVEPFGFKKNATAYVFFTPHAWEVFATSIGYGKWIAENELESHYFLEGYFFTNKNTTSTVVTNIIIPNSASQGKTFAQLYSKENNSYAFVEQKEAELIKYASKGRVNSTSSQINPFFERFGAPIRVGFGHTHPNIGVFFSSVDKTSVFAAYGEPWITMVVDPRREELLAAVGADMKTANIVTFKQHNREPAHQNKSHNITTTKEVGENFIEFIKFIDAQISSGCSAKIKISGKFPGKLRFKGKLNLPNRKSEIFGRKKP